jgi:hypothetical protein
MGTIHSTHSTRKKWYCVVPARYYLVPARVTTGLINPADFFTKILPVYRHIAALPFLHGTWHSIPYPFCTAPPPHHIPSSPSIQSSRCSLRQGLPYHSLPITLPHFYLPSFLRPPRIASNTPMLFPCSFPTLKQGNQRTRQPRNHRRMLVFKTSSCSCIYSSLCSCLT